MSCTGETQLSKAEVNVSFTVEDIRHFLEEEACEQERERVERERERAQEGENKRLEAKCLAVAKACKLLYSADSARLSIVRRILKENLG